MQYSEECFAFGKNEDEGESITRCLDANRFLPWDQPDSGCHKVASIRSEDMHIDEPGGSVVMV